MSKLFISDTSKDDVVVRALLQALGDHVVTAWIFEDEAGKMNRSLMDVKGSALVVSQFTLYRDARGQPRPSFVAAGPPEQAKSVYEEFAEALRRLGVGVATGVFGAMMSVELVNERSRDHPFGLGQNVLKGRVA